MYIRKYPDCGVGVLYASYEERSFNVSNISCTYTLWTGFLITFVGAG
jgi:hypothetical protein